MMTVRDWNQDQKMEDRFSRDISGLCLMSAFPLKEKKKKKSNSEAEVLLASGVFARKPHCRCSQSD